MTNEIQNQPSESKNTPFGTRLKSAREALGLERKDAAAQLRLNENLIVMLEKDKYPSDLPLTFVRGYIRAYGKLLQIPDHEIRKAIEPIQPDPSAPEIIPSVVKPISIPSVTSGDYFMQIFTYLIIFTLLGLVGVWWYSHSNNQSNSQTALIDNQTNANNAPAPAIVNEVASANNNQASPANTASKVEPPILPANKTQTSPSYNQADKTSSTAANNLEGQTKEPASQPGQTNVTADASQTTGSNNETLKQQAARNNAEDNVDSANVDNQDTETNSSDDAAD